LSIGEKKNQITFQTAFDERWVVLSTNVAINSAQKVLEEYTTFICVSIKLSMKQRPAPQVTITAFLELWTS